LRTAITTTSEPRSQGLTPFLGRRDPDREEKILSAGVPATNPLMRRALIILGFGLVLAVTACELSLGGHITPHTGPDGGFSPDGGTVLPVDGGELYPDGGFYQPDGAIYVPDAEVLFPDGGCGGSNTYYPDGGVIYYPDAFPDAP
jgi:hypothetical protein